MATQQPPPNPPDERTVEFCRTLARLQAIIAEDRVTGEDDDCIEACGTVMNYLAQEWGLDKPWLWDTESMHDLTPGEGAEEARQWAAEQWRTVQDRAERTVQVLIATKEAPTALRSSATTTFVDMLREDGVNAIIPGQEE